MNMKVKLISKIGHAVAKMLFRCHHLNIGTNCKISNIDKEFKMILYQMMKYTNGMMIKLIIYQRNHNKMRSIMRTNHRMCIRG